VVPDATFGKPNPGLSDVNLKRISVKMQTFYLMWTNWGAHTKRKFKHGKETLSSWTGVRTHSGGTLNLRHKAVGLPLPVSP
jgi:hypothetical protein